MRIIASCLALLPVAALAVGCVIQTAPADSAPPKPPPKPAAAAPKASAGPAKKKPSPMHFKDAPVPSAAPAATDSAGATPAPAST